MDVQGQDDIVVFRLYIAGRAPNSLRAQSNLKAICDRYLPDQTQVEIIDILMDPIRALDDDVLLTPTLVKVSPLPAWQIVGNLSDHSAVLAALGLESDYP